MGAGGAASAGGIIMQGVGAFGAGRAEAAAARREEQKAKNAAEVARIEADQTQTVLLQELSSTLANIRTIRASAGGDPDSPTTRAIMANEEKTSYREQRIRRSNSMMQASQYEDDARFYRKAAKNAMRGATMKAFSGVASGLGGMLSDYARAGS